VQRIIRRAVAEHSGRKKNIEISRRLLRAHFLSGLSAALRNIRVMAKAATFAMDVRRGGGAVVA